MRFAWTELVDTGYCSICKHNEQDGSDEMVSIAVKDIKSVWANEFWSMTIGG